MTSEQRKKLDRAIQELEGLRDDIAVEVQMQRRRTGPVPSPALAIELGGLSACIKALETV